MKLRPLGADISRLLYLRCGRDKSGLEAATASRYTGSMSRHAQSIGWTVLVALLAAADAGRPAAAADEELLVIHPLAWTPALSNFCRFKERLGIAVSNVTTEAIAGGGALTPGLLRAFLQDYAAAAGPARSVLLIGDMNIIPTPSFRVLGGDGSTYSSDICYRDLHTDFNGDGDAVYGEYGAGQDFTSASFPALFGGISNDLCVARAPVPAGFSAEQVAEVLAHSVAFERETGARKDSGLFTAGRITLLHPADSWEFVVKPLAMNITNHYPAKAFTTVVQVSTSYTDRTGIDYAIESDNLSETQGQSVVRSLWETQDRCSFLLNVSHGSPASDFALTTQDPGLPRGAGSAVVISMSCRSYALGVSVYTAGVAAAYFGSTAVVSPDFPSFISGAVQDQAVMAIVGENTAIGSAFDDAFNSYVAEIQGTLFYAFPTNWPAVLRNVIGFQMIGDPTLVHARADGDSDGLLDAEEATLGTVATTNDTDADGLWDGDEVYEYGTCPTDRDTDDDRSRDGDEIVAGTDPLNRDDFLHFESAVASAAGLTLAWQSVTGRVYSVAGATGLAADSWAAVAGCTNLPGDGGPQSCTNPAPGSCSFYRLQVRTAPVP